MRHEIVLAPEAVEDLQRLSARSRSQVRAALAVHLHHEPTRVGRSRIKRLKDLKSPEYRLRVGTIRIYYDVRGETVEVLAIIEKADSAAWLAERG